MDVVSASRRRHTHRTGTVACGGLIGELNKEWEVLRGSSEAAALVRGWVAVDPSFAGMLTVRDVEDAVAAARADQAREDELFRALFTVVASGDGALARRVLMQLMLPKAVSLAKSQRVITDRDERDAVVVGCLFEVICTWQPAPGLTGIAGQLSMRVLNKVYWRVQSAMTGGSVVSLAALEGVAAVEPGPTSRQELVKFLAWAVQVGVVDQANARLLVLRYRDGEGAQRRGGWWTRELAATDGGAAELAASVGLSEEAVRQRCHRAKKRLAAAVPEYLAAVG